VSNRKHANAFKAKALQYVKEHYIDFGPTLASEKLLERQEIAVNKETLRQWMMEAGLWKGKRKKAAVIHQQRARRPSRGELVQIDGSPHKWFEERGDSCCLLVFIDDATSELLQLRFEKTETTQGYFRAARGYIKRHGRPLAFYNDKHGIFRVNASEAKTGTGKTQFSRAMGELDIDIICANSPQATGRIERANSTLQDRLVKELRLEGISDIESANTFLPNFMKKHNKHFAVKAADQADAHRKTLPKDRVLDLIFTTQNIRTISKNLEVSYNNIIYQIKTKDKGYGLRHAKVTVCDDDQGNITLIYKNRTLDYKIFDKKNRSSEVASSKEVNGKVERRRTEHKPKENHPWRRYEKAAHRKGMRDLKRDLGASSRGQLPADASSLADAI